MWEKLWQLRDEEGFLPWAKVIVRFKCLSAIGALRNRRHVLSDGVLEMLADEAEAIEAETHEAARHALRACLAKFSACLITMGLFIMNSDCCGVTVVVRCWICVAGST